jgi:predicted AAA+ superfamily ATPase
MVNRIQKLSKSDNLFLFGARGTGKSTLLRELFAHEKKLWIDLLLEKDEESFGRQPEALSQHLKLQQYDFVVIDEIQKFPKLLDIIHYEIENNPNSPFFILTGSSARKLKRNSANMLGGRALIYDLFPFTYFELKDSFDLDQVLKYGSLPLLWSKQNPQKKEEYLKGYVRSYLQEEILIEQLIRQIEPFKDFLEVAAQMNGEIINYSKISKDVGVSDQTVKSFFQILEDTLIGFLLPSFNRSIRKRQRESPKFYFFDRGVVGALARTLKVPLLPRTSEYGKAFEHFIILEVMRMCEYQKNEFRMSYLRTKDDAEIDLVIERPGEADLLLEIKSTKKVQESDLTSLRRFIKDWDKPVVAELWSNDKISKKINSIDCYHWEKGLKKLFKIHSVAR